MTEIKRSAGLFIPVFALRSENDLGVGDTQCLKEMIDWSAAHGFEVLQVLPVSETSDDNSPYNSVSAYALDITTLAVSVEAIPGLTAEILNELCPESLRGQLREGPVAYHRVKPLKREICWRAFLEFEKSGQEREGWTAFCEQEKSWLDDYTLFCALMERNGSHPAWVRWQPEHQTPLAARRWQESQEESVRHEFESRRRYFAFVQWVLHRQWEGVRSHAGARGVRLMGDIPFGVSMYSVDVWAHPEQFDLHWSGGAPPEPFFQPDEFTKVWGQNWGVPVYNWAVMEADGCAWWCGRVRQVARYFHIFRIDHILGFFRIYAFPWRPEQNQEYVGLSREQAREKAGDLPRFLPSDDQSPEGCRHNEEQGLRLLKVLQSAAGEAVIVGEDLGVVPDYVRPALARMGISGFKIPLFDRQEWDREYVPTENYLELSVATLATHDHEPMAAVWENWWQAYETAENAQIAGSKDEALIEKGRQMSWELYRTLRFARLDDSKLIRSYEPRVRGAIIRRLLQARSWLAILMLTDLFGMRTRFNVPGPVAESNWSERLPFTVADINQDPWRSAVGEWIREVIAETGRAA